MGSSQEGETVLPPRSGLGYLRAMPARPRARLQLAAAAALFSTGGRGDQGRRLHRLADREPPERHRGRGDPADHAGGAARLDARARCSWDSPTRRASRCSCWPTGSPPRPTRSSSRARRRSTCWSSSPWLLKEPIRRQDLGFMAAVGARAGAVLRERRGAGGHGAGPDAGEPPGPGQRFLLGGDGVRAPLAGRGRRRARLAGGRGGERQPDRVPRRAADGAAAGRARHGRLGGGDLPRRVPDRAWRTCW